MSENERLTNFGEAASSVRFVETNVVKEGVVCDVYAFEDDPSKDLAIITVLPGHTTPLQRVIAGTKTIEGYIEGQGALKVVSPDGTNELLVFNELSPPQEIEVQVGQIMQWQAAKGTNLVFYEICEPPYEDGRFEYLPDDHFHFSQEADAN